MRKRLLISLLVTIGLLFVGVGMARAGGPRIFLPLVMNGGASGTVTPSITPTPTEATPTPTHEAFPTGPSRFGMAVDDTTTPGQVGQIAAAGSDWLRAAYTLDWSAVEAAPGERHWEALANLDAQILAARNANQTVIVTLGGTPDWALPEFYTGSGRCGPIAADRLPALAAFLSDAVERYSYPPYNVRYWELWNTPDALNCWAEDDLSFGYGGNFYTNMLAQAYPAIKEADPDAQVLVGPLEMYCDPAGLLGAACNRTHFADAVIYNGKSYFDGIAYYAYDALEIVDRPWGETYQYSNVILWGVDWQTGPTLLAKANYLNTILADAEATGKYLMPHLADLCSGCGGEISPEVEASKAVFAVEAYATAYSLGNLRAALWQSYQGPYNAGLADSNGALLPAYTAWQFASQMLGDAAYFGPVLPGGEFPVGIHGQAFTKDGKRLMALWYFSDTQPSATINFANPPAAAWDMFGNPLDVSGGIQVDPDHPVYVRFP